MGRLLLAALLLVAASASNAGDVGVVEDRFVDDERSRKVPYLIYHPTPPAGPYPVVILSHGMGGSRYTNEHLGRYLAANGFVAVHVQHPGSDRELYRGARNKRMAEALVRASVADRDNAIHRFRDIPFVIERLTALSEGEGPFRGQFDLGALGMAGHSYGAMSTMVAAGMRVGAQYRSYQVPAVRAGVLLSPGPPDNRYDAARVYQDVAIPLFHMTGTKDASFGAGGGTTAFERTKPYTTLTIMDQYLLVLDEADHVTFSGERIGTRKEKKRDKEHMAAILGGALMFFRAYLKEDEAAKAWLRAEYRKSLSEGDRFEFK